MSRTKAPRKPKAAPSIPPQELLTQALMLALSAPTDDDIDRAVALAEEIARNCSEFEIFAAKRDALRRLNMIGGAANGN